MAAELDDFAISVVQLLPNFERIEDMDRETLEALAQGHPRHMAKLRRAYVVELKHDDPSMDYADIARRVAQKFGPDNIPNGFNETNIRRDLRRERHMVMTSHEDLIEDLVQEDLIWFKKMLGSLRPRVDEGDHRAMELALKIIQTRSKIFGSNFTDQLLAQRMASTKASDVNVTVQLEHEDVRPEANNLSPEAEIQFQQLVEEVGISPDDNSESFSLDEWEEKESDSRSS